MDEQRAREILGDWVQPNGELLGLDMLWGPSCGDMIRLDSEFTADDLEAIAWWIRNHGQKSERQ